MKKCFKCNVTKTLSNFYRHSGMADGTVNKCKECNKKENKENWHAKIEKKKEYDLYRSRYSIQRIFNHRYSGIKRRCLKGGSCNRKYLVTGTSFLSKQEWDKWCFKQNNYLKFLKLYNIWLLNNFDERLSPSIDRINSQKGYITNNLQWLSKSDNCRKQ